MYSTGDIIEMLERQATTDGYWGTAAYRYYSFLRALIAGLDVRED